MFGPHVLPFSRVGVLSRLHRVSWCPKATPLRHYHNAPRYDFISNELMEKLRDSLTWSIHIGKTLHLHLLFANDQIHPVKNGTFRSFRIIMTTFPEIEKIKSFFQYLQNHRDFVKSFARSFKFLQPPLTVLHLNHVPGNELHTEDNRLSHCCSTLRALISW